MIERAFLGNRATLSSGVCRWLTANLADSTWLVVESPSAVSRLARCDDLPNSGSLKVVAAEDAAEALSPSFLSVDPLVRRQALWSALHEIPESDRVRYFPSAHREENRGGWESAIDALDALFSELAYSGFCAEDVSILAGDFLPADEHRRWKVLAEIEKAFLPLIASQVPQATRPPKRIVLAALGDLPGRFRRWIDQNRELVDVAALVAADEVEADRFDELGAVRTRRWLDAPAPIDDDAMIVAASASAQAAAAYEAVERLQKNQASVVALAALDDALTPYLDSEGCRRGHCKPQGARWLGRTAPYRLLHAVADYLEADGFRAFSALVRHPDFEQTLEREPLEGCEGCSVAEALADLDELAAQRLPDRIARFWNASWSASERRAERAVHAVVQRVKQVLDGLQGPPSPFTHRLPLVRELLERIYGSAATWTSEPLVELRRGFDDAVAWPHDGAPRIANWEAVRWLATRFASEKLDRKDDETKLQRADWPDVAWCDAEAIVLVGFNEGKLPTSRRGELFLPNALRERLSDAVGDGRRFADNDLRYALDAYRLCTAMAGRRETVLVAGRFGANGEPLLPSRFWFARPPEELPGRVQRFYEPPAPPKKSGAKTSSAAEIKDLAFLLPPPPPGSYPPITSLRVTAFKDYLACPYRFFLRHVLKLQTPETPGAEMTGAQFGSLAHDVLEALAIPELVAETDPERIFDRLSRRLDELVLSVFGDDPAPAVRIQIEQLRHRLLTLAAVQAAEVANGWRTIAVEQAIDETAGLLGVDGAPFRITGRIDRIDVNERTGAWRLLDYKTGDTAVVPDKAHRRQGEWVDLQLPLYWRLTERVRGEQGHVGYILLTKDPAAIKVEIAPWNREEMDEAIAKAEDVIRRIRRGEFWPPTSPPPDGYREFAGVCRDGLPIFEELE